MSYVRRSHHDATKKGSCANCHYGMIHVKTFPLACLSDELLATHLWHFPLQPRLRREFGTWYHVPNVGILNRCSTFSVDPESQLQSNRLRWLGHTVRMSADTLPKKLLCNLVKSRVAALQVALGLVQ